MPAVNENALSLPRRLWLYQKERFPVFKHGLLIAAFSSSGVCLSALLRGQTRFPDPAAFAISFLVLFLTFLQLRIADEFKDAADDARLRPTRPVPRGLVRRRELAITGGIAALIQLAIVLLYFPPLAFLLLAIWLYLTLMSAEFFVSAWLKARPIVYMASHMLIMPLIDLFATACDWLVKTKMVPPGLGWFLIVSFFNGVILEIGRKSWAPEMEKPGVESYSDAWGLPAALLAWSGTVLASFACALIVARRIAFADVAGPALGLAAIAALATAFSFHTKPTPAQARRLENMAGLWVFCIYLFLGIIPMALTSWR